MFLRGAIARFWVITARMDKLAREIYWLVIPLVFCENRNLGVLKQAFEEELGFALPQVYRRQVAEMVKLFREGKAAELKNFRSGGPERRLRRGAPRRKFSRISTALNF